MAIHLNHWVQNRVAKISFATPFSLLAATSLFCSFEENYVSSIKCRDLLVADGVWWKKGADAVWNNGAPRLWRIQTRVRKLFCVSKRSYWELNYPIHRKRQRTRWLQCKRAFHDRNTISFSSMHRMTISFLFLLKWKKGEAWASGTDLVHLVAQTHTNNEGRAMTPKKAYCFVEAWQSVVLQLIRNHKIPPPCRGCKGLHIWPAALPSARMFPRNWARFPSPHLIHWAALNKN